MRINILGAVFGVLIIIALDAYILLDICKYARRKIRKWALPADIVLTLLCWAEIITFFCIPKRDPDVSLLPAMWLLYIAITVYAGKLLYCLCSLVGRICTRKRGRNRGVAIGCVLGALVFCWLWWGAFVTRYQIVTNDVEISSDKLPPSFDGLRVLQFSDTHLGTFGNDTAFISKMVDEINSKNADLVLFTGDIVSRESTELDPFWKILSRIKAPKGVYSIHGNHDYSSYVDWKEKADYYNDLAHLQALNDSMGWKVLNNATDFIRQGNDSIVLIGVENWGCEPYRNLGNLGKSYPRSDGSLQGLNDNMFKILMTHNPDHWDQVVTDISNIDLTFAGHTHAMQMMLKIGDWIWSPSKFKHKAWAGLYSTKAKDGTNMNLYTNIGVGEVGFPARLGAAKPELTVFTLRSTKKQ